MSPRPIPVERLYSLLPSLYRLRDATVPGEPLRALVGLIDEQLQCLEADIAGLLENWFVETCEEWVVPYIGDLLGARSLYPVSPGTRSHRAVVASTLGYRRRKGTVAALEKLAQDITGWPARAVEYFQSLTTTAHTNHPRTTNVALADVRATPALELLGTAFDKVAHLPDVRHVASRRGKHNLPNVGIHLCRLLVDYSERTRAPRFGAGQFHIHPLGCDVPLFNPDRSLLEFSERAQERDLPVPLRRRPLRDELERWRLAQAGSTDDGQAELDYFRPAASAGLLGGAPSGQPVVRIFVDGAELLPEEIEIRDLSGDPALAQHWSLPAARTFVRNDAAHSSFSIRAALDPVAGRLAFPEGNEPQTVHVRCATGFSAHIGGGFYQRKVAPIADGMAHFIVQGGGGELDDALAAWAALAPGADGTKRAVIEIVDSETYDVTETTTSVPAHGSLEVRASNRRRPLVRLAAPWEVSIEDDGQLTVAGLLVSGGAIKLAVAADIEPARVQIDHSTLVPGLRLDWDRSPQALGGPSLTLATSSHGTCDLALTSSIAGPMAASPATGCIARLTVADSIVDGLDRMLPAIACHTACIERATVLGGVLAEILALASDAIFTDTLQIGRVQEGCIRHSYVGTGSKLPQAYRCQSTPLVPAFTSTRYGEPGYAQLHGACPDLIRAGASDGGEMGAFNFLQQPQREANLRASLDEHLRFGLEAGFFFVT